VSTLGEVYWCMISAEGSSMVGPNGRPQLKCPVWSHDIHVPLAHTWSFGLQRPTFEVMFSFHLRRLVATPAHSSTARGRGGALSVCLTFPHCSASRRYPPCPPFLLAQRRAFVAGSTPRAPPQSSQPSSPISQTPPPSPIRRTVLSRLLPASLLPNTAGTSSTSASFRKIVALARPERRPLLTAISLLLVSSSVSLSIPFTVGRLIDYFTTSNPVGGHCHAVRQSLPGAFELSWGLAIMWRLSSFMNLRNECKE
jgi:hypothetical protein